MKDTKTSIRLTRVAAPTLTAMMAVLLTGCGSNHHSDDGGDTGSNGGGTNAATTLACDDSMKTAFKPDVNTRVTLVKAFKKGDSLALSDTPATPKPPVASNDVCLVKLIVGPGNPGPAGAPSTSAGIGIEAWLPAKANWNQRIHALALGGFGGNPGISSTTVISNASISNLRAPDIAQVEGAVSGITDGGHADPVGSGAFAMNPDGSINKTLWTDVSTRAPHELASKLKSLTAAYYGAPQKKAYLEGCSGGGRQGYSEAQNFPTDYDGIVAAAPSINQTQFFPADLYPQIVFQRDLGGVAPTQAQIALVSGAAVSACDTALNGQHEGYISDPGQCRYDPTTDPSVLCTASGGTNTTAACVTAAQASAFNKIWYGPTANGSVPAPGTDNGFNAVRSPGQLWWGPTRGTNLAVLLGFTLSMDQVALNLQDPRYARPEFINATGNGQNLWKNLTYQNYADMLARGAALNQDFGNIDTDNPDLKSFMNAGGKMLTYQGLSDQLVTPQSTINYYTRSSNVLGGFAEEQKFHRLFFVPGYGHCGGVGSASGTASPVPNPPLLKDTQMYDTLTNWVEKNVAPSTVTVTTADNSISRPLCMFPQKLSYVGGDVKAAASYTCK